MSRRLAVALGATIVMVSLFMVNTHVRGDGNGYFAWLASPIVDGDLDFRNQYRHANAIFADAYLDASGAARPGSVTPTGHVEDQWAVGAAVLWAPWFLAAHAIVTVTGADPQDGYAPLYRRFCAIGSMVYGFCALGLSVRAARRLGISQAAAWGAAAAVWGASSLLVYAYLLPFHVHVLAAFTVALFLWYWIECYAAFGLRQWAVWGALAGLMGMTYYVDSVFACLVVSVAFPQARAGMWRRAGLGLTVFAICALLMASPQWVGKWLLYGSPFTTGYRDHFLSHGLQLWRTALSTNHGVILWTPIVGIGLAGCIRLARQRQEAAWLVLAATVFYVVIASYDTWHGLSSFGNRFFVSLTLPVVIGVACLLDAARRRTVVARILTVAALAGLVVWNAGLAFQWASKMIPNRGAVDVRTVVSQQWAVPGRVRVLAWRYVNDRDALARDIERQDRQEWDAFNRLR